MMTIDEIKKWLPHRYPFLLIDRVIEFEKNKSITAYKNITFNENIFSGHFPQAAIFPGVMIIEAMAQAAGILGFKSMGCTPEDGSVYLFAGADHVRFRRQVIPGDRLELQAEVKGEKRGIWKFECKASVDGELAASATILCADRKVS
jgi:3-hydroxyacyl-[acyl-carrier-protein] dehydratase